MRTAIGMGGPGSPQTTDSSGNPAGNVVVAGPTTIEGNAGEARTFNGTSAQSAAISADYVDVVADGPCWIAMGANPTAVVDTSYYLPTNTIVRFSITSGNKVAAIDDGTTGTLWIHKVS